MRRKLGQDFPKYGLVSLVITAYAEVGVPLIQGFPFVVEAFQVLAGGHCDAARVHVLDPFDEQGEGEFQQDDHAVVLQMGHGLGAVDDAPAGGDDVALEPQREDKGLLDPQEVGDAVFFEDRLKGSPLPGLDGDVRVQEGTGEFLGKEYPKRALAGPGHSDEHDVGIPVHDRSLARYGEYARNILSLLAVMQVFGFWYGVGGVIPKRKKEEPMAKKVVIDADECVACGTCVEICPEVFKMDDGADYAEVIMESGGPEDLIEEAVDSCPTQCISLEE